MQALVDSHNGSAELWLLLGLQDQSLKLWDVRMLTGSRDSGAAAGVPRCLHTFEGHREAIGGVLVQGMDAVSFAGQHLGVFSLQVHFCCLVVKRSLLDFKEHVITPS